MKTGDKTTRIRFQEGHGGSSPSQFPYPEVWLAMVAAPAVATGLVSGHSIGPQGGGSFGLVVGGTVVAGVLLGLAGGALFPSRRLTALSVSGSVTWAVAFAFSLVLGEYGLPETGDDLLAVAFYGVGGCLIFLFVVFLPMLVGLAVGMSARRKRR